MDGDDMFLVCLGGGVGPYLTCCKCCRIYSVFYKTLIIYISTYLVISSVVSQNNMQEGHSPSTYIRVPKLFDYLIRKRVLTMGWMTGESPNALLSMCNIM